jgi:hypothetical protein
VRLPGKRYRQLISAGARPVCRKNGCYRLCGCDMNDLASESEIVVVPGLPTGGMKGDGPLSKKRVRRMIAPDI